MIYFALFGSCNWPWCCFGWRYCWACDLWESAFLIGRGVGVRYWTGTGVLAEKGLCQRMLLRCRFFRLISLAGPYTVGWISIHFRRVLSGMEVRLGQRLLCRVIVTAVVFLMPAGTFVVVIGLWLLSRWTYCSHPCPILSNGYDPWMAWHDLYDSYDPYRSWNNGLRVVQVVDQWWHAYH